LRMSTAGGAAEVKRGTYPAWGWLELVVALVSALARACGRRAA